MSFSGGQSVRRLSRRGRRLLAAALAAALALSVFEVVPAAQAATAPGRVDTPSLSQRPAPQLEPVRPSNALAVKAAAAANPTGGRRRTTGPTWPAAGTATATGSAVSTPQAVTSTASSSTGLRRAGSTPILVGHPVGGAATPSTVTVLAHDAAVRAGVDGVLFTVTQAAGGVVGIDYSQFAEAAGAGFGSRFHLVALPSCALTAPTVAHCRRQTPISSVNDTVRQLLTGHLPNPSPAANAHSRAAAPTAALATAATPMVLAAVSGVAGSNGSFAASSLSPSGSWSTTGGSGAFTWSYPVSVPPAAAGADVTPQIGLSYNSASVDGQVAITNNQSSWIGEGWDYQPGFVERTYQTCAADPAATTNSKTGDQCWAGQIITMSLGGKNLSLIRDDTTGTWHARGDATEKVEQLTGAANGARNGEYWKITAANGVQYFFGRNSLGDPGESNTNSTLTVPVYGAHVGDPCYSTTGFAASSCTQGWRWNLDFVQDPHGNLATYYYTPETNVYAADNATTGTSVYTRAAYLSQIDYGQRNTGSTTFAAPAPQQIRFTVAERCIPSGSFTCDPGAFTAANATNWPDVPQDQQCSQGATCSNHSPTFWTTKRLTNITTSYHSGTGYLNVDGYTLGQSIPATGDPEIQLNSITRTGYSASPAITLPAQTFAYQLMNNRVPGYLSQTAMSHWRMTQVNSETGTATIVTYGQPTRPDGSASGCTAATVPASPATDTMLCFPVYWTLPFQTAPTLDYFQKYMVTQVTVQDTAGLAPSQITTYSYLGLPAWHLDDSELTPPAFRTYGQFRGYGQLEVRTGNPGNTSNGTPDKQTLTRTTYLRGMGGAVTNSLGESVSDSNDLAGAVLQSQTFNGAGGSQLSTTLSNFAVGPAIASRARTGLPNLTSNLVTTTQNRKLINLAAGGTLQTSSGFTYDSLGRKLAETDSGTNVPDACTYLTYADSSTAWIRDRVGETIAASGVCPAGAAPGASVITADTRRLFDNSTTPGFVGATGDQTETDTATTSTATWARTTAAYDPAGRTVTSTAYLSATDTVGRTSTTAYTQTADGQLAQVVNTNALQQNSTVTTDPGRGLTLSTTDIAGHRTDATYDALGRVTALWRPGQIKGTDPATATYNYLVRGNAPLAITSGNLVNIGASQSYVYSLSLLNQFGNAIQTQADAEGTAGNRTVTDTFYDSHGWPIGTDNHWYTSGVPGQCGATLVTEPVAAPCAVTTAPANVDSRTLTSYDAAGRAVTVTQYRGATPTGTTTTIYGGDRTTVLPPTGGTTQTSVTDARGHTIDLAQYTAPPTVTGSQVTGGSHQDTTYAYDTSGRQTAMTDPAGAHWTSRFDLAGRAVGHSDPDTGSGSTSYDNVGDVTSTTDARGQSMAYSYDALGRKTGEFTGTSTTGPQTASWLYDTLQAGQPTSSTRITPAGNYVTAVTGYDAYGNATGTSTVIPAADTGIAGTYTTAQTWSKTHLRLSLREPGNGNGGLLPETVGLAYTRLGDPLSSSGLNAYASATTYSPYGEPTQIAIGVNVQSGWLTLTRDLQTRNVVNSALTAQTAAPAIDANAYTYDPSGNIVKQVNTQGFGTTAPVQTTCYTYNLLDQLTQAWSAKDNCTSNPTTAGNTTVAGPQPFWTTWTIDAAGNRTQQLQHALPGQTGNTTTDYTYASTGHVHAASSAAITGPTGTLTGQTFTYDAAGNAATRTGVNGGTQTLAYNPQGRAATLTTTTAAGGIAAGTSSYTYTADGTQLIRRDPGSTTLYLGDSQLTYNTTAKTYTSARYYSHAGYTLVERVNGGNPIFLSADINNTNHTMIATSSAGFGAITRRHLDPYGNPLGTPTGTWPDHNSFLNQPLTAGTGFIDMGARLYDPTQGKFLSVDPVLTPFAPAQNNGYSYGANNPLTHPDPTGRCYQDTSTGNYVGLGCGGAPQSVTTENTNSAGQTTVSYNVNISGGDVIAVEAAHIVANPTASINNSGGGDYAGAIIAGVAGIAAGAATFAGCTAATGGVGAVIGGCEAAAAYVGGATAGAVGAANSGGSSGEVAVAAIQGGTMATNGSDASIFGANAVGSAAAESTVPAIKAGSAGGDTAGMKFPASVRQEELSSNPNICVYCHMPTDNPQVDHAIPRSRGGNATIANAQTTCPHCNASKGARDFPVTPPQGYEGEWPPSWWGLGGP